MINTKYGSFEEKQLNEFKKKLHNDLFWLILYKDEKTKQDYQDVNFDKYFVFLMKKINGLNSLLFNPKEIIEIMSLLEAAYIETQNEKFKWTDYRKLIFDAQSIVDEIGRKEV